MGRGKFIINNIIPNEQQGDNVELQNPKGTKDFPPEEKIKRDILLLTLKRIFERFGFLPLETPIIDRLDVLSAKYAGGAEILKETFTLKDQGQRELGLRYDLTVPMSRFVGMNPTLKLPFKRYELGPVFRDGPIKKGRMRQFWQCDVDTVGTKNMLADAEFIQLTQAFFKEIGLKVRIEVNSRKILDGIMESLNIPEEKKFCVITAIDKLKKVQLRDIEAELAEAGIGKKQMQA